MNFLRFNHRHVAALLLLLSFQAHGARLTYQEILELDPMLPGFSRIKIVNEIRRQLQPHQVKSDGSAYNNEEKSRIRLKLAAILDASKNRKQSYEQYLMACLLSPPVDVATSPLVAALKESGRSNQEIASILIDAAAQVEMPADRKDAILKYVTQYANSAIAELGVPPNSNAPELERVRSERAKLYGAKIDALEKLVRSSHASVQERSGQFQELMGTYDRLVEDAKSENNFEKRVRFQLDQLEAFVTAIEPDASLEPALSDDMIKEVHSRLKKNIPSPLSVYDSARLNVQLADFDLHVSPKLEQLDGEKLKSLYSHHSQTLKADQENLKRYKSSLGRKAQSFENSHRLQNLPMLNQTIAETLREIEASSGLFSLSAASSIPHSRAQKRPLNASPVEPSSVSRAQILDPSQWEVSEAGLAAVNQLIHSSGIVSNSSQEDRAELNLDLTLLHLRKALILRGLNNRSDEAVESVIEAHLNEMMVERKNPGSDSEGLSSKSILDHAIKLFGQAESSTLDDLRSSLDDASKRDSSSSSFFRPGNPEIGGRRISSSSSSSPYEEELLKDLRRKLNESRKKEANLNRDYHQLGLDMSELEAAHYLRLEECEIKFEEVCKNETADSKEKVGAQIAQARKDRRSRMTFSADEELRAEHGVRCLKLKKECVDQLNRRLDDELSKSVAKRQDEITQLKKALIDSQKKLAEEEKAQAEKLVKIQAFKQFISVIGQACSQVKLPGGLDRLAGAIDQAITPLTAQASQSSTAAVVERSAQPAMITNPVSSSSVVGQKRKPVDSNLGPSKR